MTIPLPEIKVYRVGRTRLVISVIYLLFGSVIFGVLAWVNMLIITSNSAWPLIIFLPASIMVGLGVYTIADEATAVLRLESDRLDYRNIFVKRAISYSEIRGFRARHGVQRSFSRMKTIYVSQRKGKDLAMSVYIENQPTLLAWLDAHFRDLDVGEFVNETQDLLQDAKYGKNEDERFRLYAKATTTARIINGVGLVSGAGVAFLSNPHPAILMLAGAVFPFSVAAVWWFGGILYFNNKTNSPHPSVAFGIICTSVCFLIRSVFDYNLLDYGKPWLPVCLGATALWLLLLAVTSEFRERSSMDIANAIAFLFFLLMYSYGLYVFSNAWLAKSVPKVISATVVNKEVKQGTYTDTFVITVAQVEDFPQSISVPEGVYRQLEVDRPVNLNVQMGKWGTSWYYLSAP